MAGTGRDRDDVVAALVEREYLERLVERIDEPQVADLGLGVDLALAPAIDAGGGR